MEFSYAEFHAFPDGPKPHSGNPAGVVLLHRDLSDADLLGTAEATSMVVVEDSRSMANASPPSWSSPRSTSWNSNSYSSAFEKTLLCCGEFN